MYDICVMHCLRLVNDSEPIGTIFKMNHYEQEKFYP